MTLDAISLFIFVLAQTLSFRKKILLPLRKQSPQKDVSSEI
jgi:hypothetical protein